MVSFSLSPFLGPFIPYHQKLKYILPLSAFASLKSRAHLSGLTNLLSANKNPLSARLRSPRCLLWNLCEMEIFMWTFVKFMDIRGLGGEREKGKGFEMRKSEGEMINGIDKRHGSFSVSMLLRSGRKIVAISVRQRFIKRKQLEAEWLSPFSSVSHFSNFLLLSNFH